MQSPCAMRARVHSVLITWQYCLKLSPSRIYSHRHNDKAAQIAIAVFMHQQKGTWLQLSYYALLCLIELIRHNKAVVTRFLFADVVHPTPICFAGLTALHWPFPLAFQQDKSFTIRSFLLTHTFLFFVGQIFHDCAAFTYANVCTLHLCLLNNWANITARNPNG